MLLCDRTELTSAKPLNEPRQNGVGEAQRELTRIARSMLQTPAYRKSRGSFLVEATFTGIDGISDGSFTFDFDPSQCTGSRTAFGARLMISGNLKVVGRKAQPLEMGGILSWETEHGNGLAIPQQPAYGGTTPLVVPISDRQLAGIEAIRASGEAKFGLSLYALARREDGTPAVYKSWGALPYVVPRDRWKDALAGCGYGKIHIVELPVPPEVKDAWARSAATLAESSNEFAQGNYGFSLGHTRNAIQQIVDVLEQTLDITSPPSLPFGNRVEAVSARLTELHAKRSADPYAVLGSLVRSAFDFSSDPVHRGYEIPNREDALLALSLTVALHTYLARRPIPKPAQQPTSPVR